MANADGEGDFYKDHPWPVTRATATKKVSRPRLFLESPESEKIRSTFPDRCRAQMNKGPYFGKQGGVVMGSVYIYRYIYTANISEPGTLQWIDACSHRKEPGFETLRSLNLSYVYRSRKAQRIADPSLVAIVLERFTTGQNADTCPRLLRG
jgi:hypothetical protein